MMFANLMRSELSRLRYRRRSWGSVILVALAGLFIPSMWMANIRRPTDQERLMSYVGFISMRAEGGCPECTPAHLQTWWSFERAIREGIGSGSIVLALIAFLIVITYVAADFSSGAMSTQLTFTPRRSVVLLSRAIACGVLGALLMLVGMLSATALTIVGFLATDGLDAIGTARGLLGVMSGAVLYGALLGIIAALLTFIIPAAPLAMAASAGVLVGNVVVSRFDPARVPDWVFHVMPIQAGEAMVLGGSVITDWSGELNVIVSRGEAILFHAVVILVLFVVAAASFERRDIKG